MKKLLVFLSGFLLGPLIILSVVYFFLLSSNKSGDIKGPNSLTNSSSSAPSDGKPILLHAELDLTAIPPNLLPPKPWVIGIAASTSTNTWGNPYRGFFMAEGIDKFPHKLVVDLSIDSNKSQNFGDYLVSSNSPNNSNAKTQELSFSLSLGSRDSMQKFAFEPNIPVGAKGSIPPFALTADVFKTVPKDVSELQKTGINLGTVYFREFYEPVTSNPYLLCPSTSKVDAKIHDPTKELSAMSRGKDSYIAIVPDEFFIATHYEMVMEANKGARSYSELYRASGPVEVKADGTTALTVTTEKFLDNIFSRYFLVFCAQGQKKDSCLNSFAAGYYKQRVLAVKKSYYPLVPKNLALPRCDKKNLEFYFYPFNNEITSPNNFLPQKSNPNVPAEIIEGGALN